MACRVRFGVLAAIVLTAPSVPAAACVIPPPVDTPAGRAAAARQAQAWKDELDRAEAAFVARVEGRKDSLGRFAVTVQPLRGRPPARIDLGPPTDCSPFWRGGDRLLIFANRKGGRWTVLSMEVDTPLARSRVRPRAAH